MNIIYIGLGKMGFNMVERLLEKGYNVAAFDPNEEARKKIAKAGAKISDSLSSAVELLESPRIIWLMVPWRAVDSVLKGAIPYLKEGDVVVDGGNSPYEESIRRARALEESGIGFLDAGISGGPEGARNGACVMIGGKKDIFKKHEQLFKDIAAPEAYGYMGRSGSGHFVKMVHNGIEYGMMQSIAEGFSVMKKSDFNLNLAEVARVYGNKSVIESRLVWWLRSAFEEFGEDLNEVSGEAANTGEGLWTVEAARELNVPVSIIEVALKFREESKNNPSYAGKILSALRNRFGGHNVKVKNEK